MFDVNTNPIIGAVRNPGETADALTALASLMQHYFGELQQHGFTDKQAIRLVEGAQGCLLSGVPLMVTQEEQGDTNNRN